MRKEGEGRILKEPHAHTQRATVPGERVQRKANPPPAPTLSSHIIPHQAASL